MRRAALPLLVLSIAGCGGGATANDAAPQADAATPNDAAVEAALDAAADAPVDTAAVDLVPIPAGSFEMGDHVGNGSHDPRHPSDEVPIHTVSVSAFSIARTETTCAQFVPFLADALAKGEIAVHDATVTRTADGAVVCDTADATAPNCVTWNGATFGVAAGRERHPVSGVRWIGAAAFSNWLGATLGLAPCYDLATGEVTGSFTCIRLPTEAEWEYAARGGLTSPYADYPWGDTRDDARVNWVGSGDPWEQGAEPLTTPVGFFDGSLRRRADFGWPDAVESYQTLDGRNGYGLDDMAGNVWEWVHDWYDTSYYAASPSADPLGPPTGSPMPDGKPYHVLRGGSFFNSTAYRGDHERVSNRDPAYFRGKYLNADDPNGPWFHVGFRVAEPRR